ncbi:MAG TPA: oligosaccharide flippase family protein, partial [Clostridia bacterium]|nr:oligosaccharide flippase family protein [Clostridia bacterium]
VRLLYVAAVFLFIRRAEDIVPFALVSSGAVFLNHFLGFLYIRRRVKRKKTRMAEVTALIKPLAVMMLLANANLLYLMLDRLYLSAFAPEKAYVTYYTLPMLIMSAVMNVLSSLVYVTVPRLSHKLSKGDQEGYKNLLTISAHTFFLIAMPVCAGIGAL